MNENLFNRLFAYLPSPGKFSAGIIWNVASFMIMGLAGVGINLLIARYYSAEVLGIFNQVYSVYILLSQLAAGGIHLSVLKYIAQFPEKRSEHNVIMTAALLAAAIISLFIVFFAFTLKNAVGSLLDSQGVTVGTGLVLPGLFLFSLNKVLLSFLNGSSRMKAYAVFQTLRYVLMTVSLIMLISYSCDGNDLPVIFSITEIVLFAALLAYSLRFFSISLSSGIAGWFRKHVVFGSKAVVGNMLADVNTRVDVLILGVFISDAMVGIYSFAAMLVDGFNQLAVVFRTSINPILSQLRYNKRSDDLNKLLRKGKRSFYLVLASLGLVVILCFPLMTYALGINEEYGDGFWLFFILMTGSIMSSGYMPFQMIFNQTGFPFAQSIYFFLVFMTNVALNLTLVPYLGAYGAAIATSIASLSQICYLSWLAPKVVGIKI